MLSDQKGPLVPDTSVVSGIAPLLTWVGFVAFVVLCLVMGWLVPWRFHRETVNNLKETSANLRTDRDLWRETALNEGEARRESEGQNRELLEVARMTYALVLALQKVTGAQPVSPVEIPVHTQEG